MKIERWLLFKHFNVSRELMLDLNRIVWAASLGLIFFGALLGAPFAGFVRSLGVGDFMFGIIMALPVMGGLFQVIAAYTLETTGARKKIFFITGIIQRSIIIPMVLLSLIIPSEMKGLLIGLVMFLLVTSSISGSFNNVTFFSWMAAIIPMRIRGRYFSQRQMIFTFTALLGGLGVSFLLDRIAGSIGFVVVFVLVSILGILDILCFIKVQDPPMDVARAKIPLVKIWKETLSHKNFKRYLLFWSVWTFGVNIPVPFFADYMLSYLNMTYLQIALMTQTIFSVFTMLMVRNWGNLIDEYGNKPVFRICGLVAVFTPLLWVFSTPDMILSIPIIFAVSGMFWCGAELAANNLMLGLPPDKNRSFYIASFSMVSSLMGSILAYLIGGLIMQVTRGVIVSLDIILLGYPMNNYHLLFIISAAIRLGAVILLLPAVHEEGAMSSRTVLKHIFDAIKGTKRGFTV